MKITQITPMFVEEIPNIIDEEILYVSLRYNSVIHRCACGCREIISTPLDREYGWTMKYDGEHISLYPSIGNGAYECHSHYFIRDNHIIWLGETTVVKQRVGQNRNQYLKKAVKCLKNIYSRIKK